MKQLKAFERTISAGAVEPFEAAFTPDYWIVWSTDTWSGRIAAMPGGHVPASGAFRVPSGGGVIVPGLGYQLAVHNGTAGAVDLVVVAVSGYPVSALGFGSSAAVAGTDYIVLTDQKPSGTLGDTATAGAWRVRTLNTEVCDTGNHCTLASNQFTLAAGTYRYWAANMGARVGGHRCRLYNASAAIGLQAGTPAVGGTGGFQIPAIVNGRFTIASDAAYELHARCTNSYVWGEPLSFGEDEVYATVMLWREPD